MSAPQTEGGCLLRQSLCLWGSPLSPPPAAQGGCFGIFSKHWAGLSELAEEHLCDMADDACLTHRETETKGDQVMKKFKPRASESESHLLPVLDLGIPSQAWLMPIS